MFDTGFKRGLLSSQSVQRRARPKPIAQKRVNSAVVKKQKSSFALPNISVVLPKFNFSRDQLPRLNFSQPTMPSLRLPKVSIPRICLPKIDVYRPLCFLLGLVGAVLSASALMAILVLKYLTVKNPLLIGFVALVVTVYNIIKMLPQPEPISASARGWRLAMIGGAVSMVAAGVIARLAFLQTTEQDRWANLSTKQYAASVQIEGARGDIVDSQGRLLATSVPAVSIGAHPRQVVDKELVAKKLAAEIAVPEETILAQLNRDSSFVWLAQGLPRNVQTVVESLNSRAINTYPSFRRFYPQGALASSIIGRVSREGAGQAGIERIFDAPLRAESINRIVRRDAKGRLLGAEPSEGSIVTVSQRHEGEVVQLTIDTFVQKILEEEVFRGQEVSKAKDVFAVIMDAENGAILGMAQTKGFDPNSSAGVLPEQLQNMVAEVSFEPGSTMKPLVAAYALQEGVVTADQDMDCEVSGRYRVGRHTVRDVHPVGKVKMPQVIIQSSNICMVKMAEKMGGKKLHDFLSSLGLGSRSGLELPGEAQGILRRYKDWKTIDVATHSFGQGVATTAIQMVRAYGVLANGGYLVEPTLIHSKSQMAQRKKILDADAVDVMNDMMRRVVSDPEGTGKRAAIAGMSVYGKTGTAQKANPNGRGYLPDAVLSSFIGYVKGQELGLDRSLVMIVGVDEPGVKPRWGGVVAAPVFQQAMERIVAYLLTVESDVRTAAAKIDRADV